MASLTIREIAWAAGFLEGEGSFGCHGGTTRVSAGQVQKEPLDRLQRLFGGRMWLKTNHKGFPNGKPLWTWYLGRGSQGVMMTLYAMMSPKRKNQIETALALWKKARSVRKAGASICLRGHNISGYNALSVADRRYPICRQCKNSVRKAWRERTGKP